MVIIGGNMKILHPFFSFIFPLSHFIGHFSNIKKWDYIKASLILLLQAVITFAFYKTRSRWIVLLEKYNDDTQPASISIPDVLDDLFFTGMIIVFAFILPFSVYLRQPMTGIDILFAFTFSVSFLCTWAVFLKNKKDKWRYLPFLSLIGLLYTVTTHPVPNPIATTLILLCLFCVEMAASIGIQIYKAMAGGTKDLSL